MRRSEVRRYTPEEQVKIRNEFIRVKNEHPAESFEKLFERANKILPENRRRIGKGPSEIKWLQDVWVAKNKPTQADAITTALPGAKSAKKDTLAPGGGLLPLLNSMNPHVDKMEEKPFVSLPQCAAQMVNPLEYMKTSMVPVLTEWLAPVMNAALMEAMSHAFQAAMSETNMAKNLQEIIQGQEVKMKTHMKESTGKRILIVGLQSGQNQFIEKEFGACFRLRFAETDANIRQVIDNMKNSDFVIGMTGKISHSLEETLKKHPGYVRVKGLLDGLRHELTAIYVNHS